MSFTSHFSIPYTHAPSPLQTLDLHTPTTPPKSSKPSYTIIYIHGGAFRDPLITSQSLLPSLPFLFPPPNPNSNSNPKFNPDSSNANSGGKRVHNIKALASLNYRLTPYPHHPTHPSSSTANNNNDEEEGRNAKWPDQVRDTLAAMRWILLPSSSSLSSSSSRDQYHHLSATEGNEEDDDDDAVILVGHSVGATIAFAVALGLYSPHTTQNQDEHEDAFRLLLRRKIRAVVGVEGIYDFAALRDAHLEYRGIYEDFTSGAFGDENAGNWEKGDLVRVVREGGTMGEVEVVVLGQSRSDELVEWGQVEMMKEALREKGWRDGDEVVGIGKEVVVVELRGGHDEIWEKGEELAKCIKAAVERCVRRNLYGAR
ncbi:MAG: hypothetical protein Q9178_004143 [Gyalolechia marmorata]